MKTCAKIALSILFLPLIFGIILATIASVIQSAEFTAWAIEFAGLLGTHYTTLMFLALGILIVGAFLTSDSKGK